MNSAKTKPASRRVALWLAIGHLATEEHRLRILSIQTGTQRETKARQLALDWLDEVVIPAPNGPTRTLLIHN